MQKYASSFTALSVKQESKDDLNLYIFSDKSLAMAKRVPKHHDYSSRKFVLLI